LQSFQSPSRGIFLTLPKNQDGIWTEYTIKKVAKSEKIAVLNPSFDENIKENTENTKFEEIKEWNEVSQKYKKLSKFYKKK
jgi:hypothetical protein